MNALEALTLYALFFGGLFFLMWLLAKILEWYADSHPFFCEQCGEEQPPRGIAYGDPHHPRCPHCGAIGPIALMGRRRARRIRLLYQEAKNLERESASRPQQRR
ncbi:MAG: hypothetical protein ABSH34_11320 [Verrucomicrobiota bacterium]|jgi:hypothetical protein